MNSTVVGDKLHQHSLMSARAAATERCNTPACDVPTLRDRDNCAELDAKEWARRARLARQN